MCTRYSLIQSDLRQVLVQLGIAPPDPLPASRYNVPPGSFLPAVRSGASGSREFALLRWGLVPAWARAAGHAPVNARAETLAEKPTFRDAFRRRRCLIPASGFFEWQTRGRVKQPWLIRRTDEAPFCFAGLWDTWTAPDDAAPLETCAVITTAPNALMAPIHDRMPVILREDRWEQWINPSTEAVALTSLLHGWDPSLMTAITVSSRVSSVRHDDETCIAPAPAIGEEQGELF
jgi:putative SOS response-associated peptidase YedK